MKSRHRIRSQIKASIKAYLNDYYLQVKTGHSDFVIACFFVIYAYAITMIYLIIKYQNLLSIPVLSMTIASDVFTSLVKPALFSTLTETK